MKRKLRGKVTSDRMEKTIVISVDSRKTHPLYRKKYLSSKKYMAENEAGAKKGDFVIIEEMTPKSKLKKWKAVKVISKKELEEQE